MEQELLQTQEKQYSYMIKTYNQVLTLLSNHHHLQGSSLLKGLLHKINNYNDDDLKQLKYSCLVSLAHVQKEVGNLMQSISCLYEAVCLKDEFVGWIKISHLCETIQLYDQVEFSLKKALRKCPQIFRQRLIEKLVQIYEKNNKKLHSEDLRQLMKKPEQINNILNSEDKVMEDESSNVNIEFEIKDVGCEKNINQMVIVFSKSQQNWEYLLSLIYLLLKCKFERNLKGKKYLKKYQEQAQKFIQQFNPNYNKIKLIFQKQQIIIDQSSQFTIKHYVKEYLSHQLPKKKRKNKKGQQSNKKKNQINHHRTNYPNFSTYLKEINHKNGFQIEQLFSLSPLSPKNYHQVMQSIISDQIPEELNQGLSKESEENILGQKTTGQQLIKTSQEDFTKFVQKNNFICEYNNIYYMAGSIIQHFIQSKQKQPNICLENVFIKKLLVKCIVKLIQQSEGFLFNMQTNITFLELLVQKYEQITYKNPKSKQFKLYQQNKLNLISKIVINDYEHQIFDLASRNQNEDVLKMSLSLIRFYSVHNNVSQTALSKLTPIYESYYNLEMKQKNIWWLQKGYVSDISSQIQRRIKKANLRTKTLFNVENQDRSIPNIEQFLNENQDQELIIKLNQGLNKIFNQNLVFLYSYLQSIVSVFNTYVRKLIQTNKSEFNSRIVSPICQYMKLQKIIKQLHQKLSNQYNSQIITSIKNENCFNIIAELLFLLIKLYLIQPYQDVLPLCRIIFFFTNCILNNMSLDDRKKYLPNIIKFYDKMIKIKKNKPQLYQNLQKKFYNILLSKNIYLIFQDLDQNQPQTQEIFDIFQTIYYDKQKDFMPKKIEDSIGFFVFLNKSHRKTFLCRQIDLQSVVNRVFRKCYKLYAEKQKQIFKFCQKFLRFQQFFYNNFSLPSPSNQNDIKEQENKIDLLSIYKAQIPICSCCNYLEKDKSLLDVLFILGKYFQSQQFNDGKKIDKEKNKEARKEKDEIQNNQEKQKHQIQDKDGIEVGQSLAEKYYLQLLLLDLKSVSNWENIVRINCQKVYRYFDSLVSAQPIQSLKNSFFNTKKLLFFIKKSLGKRFMGVCQHLSIINILKIFERKFNLCLADWKEQQGKKLELKNKYQNGLKTISQNYESQDIRTKYLGFVELRIPTLTIQIKKQLENPGQQQNIDNITNNISVLMEQLIVLAQQVFKSQESEDNVKHLYEDLFVQFYSFILQIFLTFSRVIANRMIKDVCVSKILLSLKKIAEFILSEKFQLKIIQNYRFRDMQGQNNQQNLFIDNFISKRLDKSLINCINELLKFPNLVIGQILVIFMKIPQIQAKRYKYRRSVTTSALWCSKIHLIFNSNLELANATFKQYYNLKNDDIVYVYHHYERQSTQKNPFLAEFYDRSIIYMMRRAQLIEHLFILFENDIESQVQILKKLIKACQIGNGKLLKAQYGLFLRGLGLLLICFKEKAEKSRIDEKYQKIILEWRNRIKKNLQKGEKLLLLESIQNFIKHYEQKYMMKIRLKKKKEEVQVINSHNLEIKKEVSNSDKMNKSIQDSKNKIIDQNKHQDIIGLDIPVICISDDSSQQNQEKLQQKKGE